MRSSLAAGAEIQRPLGRLFGALQEVIAA